MTLLGISSKEVFFDGVRLHNLCAIASFKQVYQHFLFLQSTFVLKYYQIYIAVYITSQNIALELTSGVNKNRYCKVRLRVNNAQH